MKSFFLALAIVLIGAESRAQIFTESFDSLPGLLSNGWLITNRSMPLGSSNWMQGTTAVGLPAYQGAPTAYVEDNYNAVSTLGTISDWLISPAITINDGDSIVFYTVSYNSHTYPDRLECRLSSTGTNTGTNASSVGDFTTLIVSVNPALDTFSYPSVVGGGNWKRYAGVVSSLGAPTSCHLAFRYFVTNAGSNGDNGSVIGVDELSVVLPAGVEEIQTLHAALYPSPAQDQLHLNFSSPDDYVFAIVDVAGRTVQSGTLHDVLNTIDIAALDKGVYAVTVRASGKSFRKIFVKS